MWEATACGPETSGDTRINVVASLETKELHGICGYAIMRLNDRMAQSKGCREMGKRVRLKWPDRIKQPRKPVRFEQHTPFEERIFGKQITLEELRLRIEYRKGF